MLRAGNAGANCAGDDEREVVRDLADDERVLRRETHRRRRRLLETEKSAHLCLVGLSVRDSRGVRPVALVRELRHRVDAARPQRVATGRTRAGRTSEHARRGGLARRGDPL